MRSYKINLKIFKITIYKRLKISIIVVVKGKRNFLEERGKRLWKQN